MCMNIELLQLHLTASYHTKNEPNSTFQDVLLGLRGYRKDRANTANGDSRVQRESRAVVCFDALAPETRTTSTTTGIYHWNKIIC